MLHLPNMQAVKLISTPLCWTAALLARMLEGTASAALAILHCNVSLRQTVKKQTTALAEGFVHESWLQERQRIGPDLHDNLHLELTGVGMLRVRGRMLR